MSLVSILRMPIMLGRWVSRTVQSPTTSTSSALTLRSQLRLQSRQCETPKPKCGERFPFPCAKETIIVKPPQPAPKPLPPAERDSKQKQLEQCCRNPCKHAMPRFDTLYYRRSDKLKREYQQTWAECPEFLRRPKLICCSDKIKFPKWHKRPRKERPQTACKIQCETITGKCPRIKMPRCRMARVPPRCQNEKVPKDCRKRKAPFPAFSECTREKPRPCRPMECKCVAVPTMCEVWEYHHRQQKIKVLSKC